MDNQRYLRVHDTSCTAEAPVRTHDIIVHGQVISVTFKHGEETVLPFEQGVKFMQDGFKVEEVDGSSVVLPTIASDAVNATLAPDECVAKYVELTLSSLRIRAAQKPGGEVYLNAGEETRDDIIAFLIGKAPEGFTEAESEFVDGEENLLDDDDEANGGAGLSGDLGAATLPAPGITEEEFAARYSGFSFSDLMIALQEKFGAVSYNANLIGPNSYSYDLLAADGAVVASGDLDSLIAREGVNPPPAQEQAAPAAVPQEDPEATADASSGVSGGVSGEPAKEEGSAGPADEKKDFSLDEVKAATDDALELALQYGVDVKSVQGSGAKGNVLKADVEAFIAANGLQPKTGE